MNDDFPNGNVGGPAKFIALAKIVTKQMILKRDDK